MRIFEIFNLDGTVIASGLVNSLKELVEANGANLQGVSLQGANLRGANLSGTCLDPNAKIPQASDQAFLDAGFELSGDYILGWRTQVSQHCGSTQYAPGQMYQAPWFSTDASTDCHPGLYLASKTWMEKNYPQAALVRCKALKSEVLGAGNKFRAKRLWVME